MFDEAFPKIYKWFTENMESVFGSEYKIYYHDVSDVDEDRFPYIVVVPAAIPRRRFLKDQRNLEFNFRVRFVNRIPTPLIKEKMQAMLTTIGKFVDTFDATSFTIMVDDKEVVLNADTADAGIGMTLVRDNTYTIVAFSFIYTVYLAKY